MLIEDVLEGNLAGITLIYGPAGAGKSTAALEALRGRTVYISTSKNFSVERLQKMRPDADSIIAKLVLFEPDDLLSMERSVQTAVQLSAVADLIVIDSIGTFIRSSNRKLGNQALGRMLEQLRKSKCPVLLTSEVYDYLSEGGGVAFVGGDMLRLAADSIIELNGGVLRVRKHKLHSGRERDYRITDTGLQKA